MHSIRNYNNYCNNKEIKKQSSVLEYRYYISAKKTSQKKLLIKLGSTQNN